jgi:hypothetical protein
MEVADVNVEQLRDKASALGFSFERGMSNGSGYMLVHDASGDRPLGSAYTAYLKDIDRYLDSYALNAGVDVVEIGNSELSKPPLTMTGASKALEGHKDARKIKEVLSPPPSGRQAQRDRIALDRLFFTGMDTRSSMAFDKLSDAEKEAHRARLRAALEEEDRAKAAGLPKPTIPLRTIGINSDHPLAQERARQSRVFQRADQLLTRTNISSRRDGENEDLDDNEVLFRRPKIEEEEPLPPEPGTDYAPKAPCIPKVVVARPKLTRAEIVTRKANADAKQRADERQRRIDEITAEVSAKYTRRKPGIGQQLKEMRQIVSPSDYQAWLRGLGIPEASARRWAAEG